jgi:hypothetical protein
MGDLPSKLTRRDLLAVAGVAGAVSVAGPNSAALATGFRPAANRRLVTRPFGSGGRPTTNRTIARLAREYGHGEPVMFVDLAAVDQNLKVIVDFAKGNHWASVRRSSASNAHSCAPTSSPASPSCAASFSTSGRSIRSCPSLRRGPTC